MTKRYYRELRQIHLAYRDRGFEILAFPCNQFFMQESWNELRIKNFIRGLKVEFPLFAKVKVNGADASNLFKHLRANSQLDSYRISWNFGKFLINREGQVVDYYSPSVNPSQVVPQIEEML